MTVTRSGRARPLSPQERRDSILDAAVPLLVATGAEVTTRQIADAAGVAEGTLFRVFPDKQAIVDAAVVRFLDPTPTLEALAAIDRAAPVEAKVLRIAEILRARFVGVTGILTALGLREPPPGAKPGVDKLRATRSEVAKILEPHRAELRTEPETVAHMLRLMCFAAALPPIAGVRETSTQEIVDVVLHGVLKEGD